MTPTDWATIAAALASVLTALLVGLRFLVRSYLHELKPNSGSTLSDRVTRIEVRVDDIYKLIAERHRHE